MVLRISVPVSVAVPRRKQNLHTDLIEYMIYQQRCQRRPLLSTILTLHVSPVDSPHPPPHRSQRLLGDLPLDILTATPPQGPVMLSCEIVSRRERRLTRRELPLAKRSKRILTIQHSKYPTMKTQLLLPTMPLPVHRWNLFTLMRALRPACPAFCSRESGDILNMMRVGNRRVIYSCPHTQAINRSNPFTLVGYELLEFLQDPLPGRRIFIGGSLSFVIFWLAYDGCSLVALLLPCYFLFVFLLLNLLRKGLLAGSSSTDDYLMAITNSARWANLLLGLAFLGLGFWQPRHLAHPIQPVDSGGLRVAGVLSVPATRQEDSHCQHFMVLRGSY